MESKKIKPSLKRDTELLFEIGTLRYLDRVWRQFLSPNVANCAEHIFRVTWIALTLAKLEKKGNHEKIMKMALAHDLPETRTGDVHYISRQYTKRHEDMAIADLFADTIHQAEMVELLAEYEERKTIEAQIVKDADYLDAELEMAELRSQGQALGSVWTESRLKKFILLFILNQPKNCGQQLLKRTRMIGMLNHRAIVLWAGIGRRKND